MEKVTRLAKALDPTRPVTYGGNNGSDYTGANRAAEIRGVNYIRNDKSGDWLDIYHRDHSEQPMIGTEEGSYVLSRGGAVNDLGCGLLDSTGNVTMPWGSTPKGWVKYMEKRDYFAGSFMWTGFDYRGEPNPFYYSNSVSGFGTIDLCGMEKPPFYYYKAWWTDEDVLKIAPHWDFQEGEDALITVFTNCDTVELFLNEKSQGVRHYDDKLCKHLYWVVPYSEGKLTAIGYKNGKKVAEHTLITTDEPYAVHISADRECISENGKDLCFITAKVVDKDGLTVPTADCNIKFNVSTGLKLCAVDNGDPEYIGSLQANNIPALSGMCLCIVGASGEKGEFAVSATAEGLESDEISVSVI